MTRRLLFRVVFVLVSMTRLCQGSKIQFTATPSEIKEEETPKLTINCALKDDTSSPNVKSVSSVTIRRVEDAIQREVAKIESGQAAQAGSWATGASVSGDLANRGGYLQATWSQPSLLQAGSYRCEIVALETDGTNIKFKANIQVQGTGPNVAELEKGLSQARGDIEALKKSISDLRADAASKTDTDTLKKAVSDLKSNVDGIEKPHNEEGTVSCDYSTNWGENLKPRNRTVNVAFARAYARTPTVNIAPVVLDVANTYNLRYTVQISNLSTTGFQVVCATWWDTIIYKIVIRWTSVVA